MENVAEQVRKRRVIIINKEDFERIFALYRSKKCFEPLNYMLNDEVITDYKKTNRHKLANTIQDELLNLERDLRKVK